MKIKMEKFKCGIYSQRYIVDGFDENGNPVIFLINWWQAKTYCDAVRFWNTHWGKRGCKALILRNASPHHP